MLLVCYGSDLFKDLLIYHFTASLNAAPIAHTIHLYTKSNHLDSIVDQVHDITFSAGHGKAVTTQSLVCEQLSLYCDVLQPVLYLLQAIERLMLKKSPGGLVYIGNYKNS